MENKEFILLNKTVFFPKQGILAVGDLHLGYEHMMIESGVAIPERQVEDMKEFLKRMHREHLKIIGGWEEDEF